MYRKRTGFTGVTIISVGKFQVILGKFLEFSRLAIREKVDDLYSFFFFFMLIHIFQSENYVFKPFLKKKKYSAPALYRSSFGFKPYFILIFFYVGLCHILVVSNLVI